MTHATRSRRKANDKRRAEAARRQSKRPDVAYIGADREFITHFRGVTFRDPFYTLYESEPWDTDEQHAEKCRISDEAKAKRDDERAAAREAYRAARPGRTSAWWERHGC